MSLVVDASVAIKWYLIEPHRTEALALQHAGVVLCAPDLIVAEIGNAMWRQVTVGQVSAGYATTAVSNAPTCFLELVPAAELAPRAIEMAIQLRHPIYDCLYLALAEREGTVVVTADRRLLNRVAATAFAALLRPLVASP